MLDNLKVKKEVGTKALWLLIKEGHPHKIGLAPLKNYQKFLHPLIETRFTHPISMTWKISDLSTKKNEELLLSYYNDMVNSGIYHPGRYGDWIKCTELNISGDRYLNLDIIGQAAWVKPTLAADLGIFIKSGPHHYFVCVERQNPPGQGLPAIMGGIMNAGKVLDSGIYTMIKEAKEELNLSITFQGNIEELRENYSIGEIPVKIHGFEKIDSNLKDIDSIIYYIATFPTTEQERNLDGTKRVYATLAYALYLDVGSTPINEHSLRKVFKAGDDAQDVVITEVTKAIIGDPKIVQEKPQFGLIHHFDLFDEMVSFYKSHILH